MIRRSWQQRRAGAAIVEMAVVLPVILILLIGTLELARMFQVLQFMSNAAREGARSAATTESTNAQVSEVVVNYLNSQSVPTQNVVVSVQDLSSPGTDAANAAPLDQLQVNVSIPWTDVRLVALYLVASPTTTLTAQATWFSQRDQAYPSPPLPPLE
jgi:Flp pilus assembly protein TadG